MEPYEAMKGEESSKNEKDNCEKREKVSLQNFPSQLREKLNFDNLLLYYY